MSTHTEQQIDMVVVGAGFAGLYMIYRARQRDLSVRSSEIDEGMAAPRIAIDTRAPESTLNAPRIPILFSTELEQEWDWSECYEGQPEIERYANQVGSPL